MVLWEAASKEVYTFFFYYQIAFSETRLSCISSAYFLYYTISSSASMSSLFMMQFDSYSISIFRSLFSAISCIFLQHDLTYCKSISRNWFLSNRSSSFFLNLLIYSSYILLSMAFYESNCLTRPSIFIPKYSLIASFMLRHSDSYSEISCRQSVSQN